MALSAPRRALDALRRLLHHHGLIDFYFPQFANVALSGWVPSVPAGVAVSMSRTSATPTATSNSKRRGVLRGNRSRGSGAEPMGRPARPPPPAWAVPRCAAPARLGRTAVRPIGSPMSSGKPPIAAVGCGGGGLRQASLERVYVRCPLRPVRSPGSPTTPAIPPQPKPKPTTTVSRTADEAVTQ